MENSLQYYELQASPDDVTVSAWQQVNNDSPIAFGHGRSLLTEKKNKVEENTELLHKMFGNKNTLGSAAYKLDGYTKKAVTKQAWQSQNNRKQVKRLVKSSKKSSSKVPSPKQLSPKEKKAWQGVQTKPPPERRPKVPGARRANSISPRTRRSGSHAAPAHSPSEVSISSHFLLKMVLNAWYSETCGSIEKELCGLRAQGKRQRRVLISILVTWRRLTTKNNRLRRLSLKYAINNNERLLQISFRWWKQTLQTKLSGFYFLQKSRKYDLHKRFRAWKKASMLSVSKLSYLQMMEKHLVGTQKKETLRTFWARWREQTKERSGKENTARRLREIVHLWSMKSKLAKIQEKSAIKYSLAAKAEQMGMGKSKAEGKKSKSKTKRLSYHLDDNNNVIIVNKAADNRESNQASSSSASATPQQSLSSEIAEIQSKQKSLASHHKHLRSSAFDSIVSMNVFLDDLNKFFKDRSSSENGGEDSKTDSFASLIEQLRSHLETSVVQDDDSGKGGSTLPPFTQSIGASGVETSGEEIDKEQIHLAERAKMQAQIDKKQAQLMKMIYSTQRKQRVMNTWMGWVTVVLTSKQREAIMIQQLRKTFSQNKFKWMTRYFLLHCRLTKDVSLHKSFQNHKQKLLFTAWRNTALSHKIQNNRARIAQQRVQKIQQYSILRHWRLAVTSHTTKRTNFSKSLVRVCNHHLDLHNLLRVWQTSTVCKIFEEKALKKAAGILKRQQVRRCIWSWHEETARLIHNKRSARNVVLKINQLRLGKILTAWQGMIAQHKKLKSIGQYVYSQTVKRMLASYYATWRASVAEIRHNRNKQQLKKLIKQMQKMLEKSKDKLELVESERDDASKKVGDLVTAVTNLNWKLQYGTKDPDPHKDSIFPGSSNASLLNSGGLSHTTPVLSLTRK